MEQQRIEIKDKYGKIYYMQSVREEDAEELMAFVRLGSEESCFFPWSREGCPKLWESPSDYIIRFLEAPRMALFKLLDGNEIVGLCELASRGYAAEFQHRFSLGTGIRKSHWGRGLAVSLNLAGEKIAVDLGYEQVEASTDSRNPRSRPALEKNGYKFCGIIPKYSKYADGSYSDRYMYIKWLREESE